MLRIKLIAEIEQAAGDVKYAAFECSEEDSLAMHKQVTAAHQLTSEFVGFYFRLGNIRIGSMAYLIVNTKSHGMMCLEYDEFVLTDDIKKFITEQKSGSVLPISIITSAFIDFNASNKDRMSYHFPTVSALAERSPSKMMAGFARLKAAPTVQIESESSNFSPRSPRS